MPTKLKDTLEKVRKLDKKSNSDLLSEFYEYLVAATEFIHMASKNGYFHLA
jgi:hypothetical protein